MSLSEPPDARLIERFVGVRVLVVGDAMLDEYIEGDADRICPEAPVPVVRVTRTGTRPGGAANVAVNAVTVGAAADLATVIGDDATGDRLLDLCREAGLGTALVVRSGHRETTRKARIIARGQQVLRVDWERTDPLSGPDIGALLEGLETASPPDVLVVSDYAKGCLTPAVLREVIARGRRWGVPVLVDPKSPDLERYRGATVVTPNRRELAAAVGASAATFEPDRIAELARPLLGRFGLDHLVVTCGADGLVVVSPDASEVVPAARRQVADVTGAGDTVVAILALALGAGAALVQAARLANLAAGLVVERVGTAAVEPDELRRAVAAGHAGRILSRLELKQRLDRWRAAGLRVVFTNGCFDLLHRGHLALLRAARERGDVLVVGLNGDRSASRLKGAGRPIVPERTRAEMLAALDVVGAVVVFDEDTPLDLIREIRPQVLVKGADYLRDQVVGGDLVEGWGGEVVLVPLVPGHSTTDLLSQLRSDAPPPA
jgi:D-beta-D-heptose 7-phosphate kinase/D-beta-D-heptose 1-phosphate adenosyltransferase